VTLLLLRGRLSALRAVNGRAEAMKTMTLEDFHAALKAQGKARIEDVTFICPNCTTLQSAQDLIDAGAGKNFDEVEKYLAFSCVGRWSNDKGCKWTLGGLFKIHSFEVVTPDGEHHSMFEPASRDDEQTFTCDIRYSWGNMWRTIL
jgi:hypothetical protein